MALSQMPLQWINSLCGKPSSFFPSTEFSPPFQPTVADKTVIKNVKVWDGQKHIPNTTIVIEGKTISLTGDASGGTVYDGKGGFLLPGLIDAHVHVSTSEGLTCLVNQGITTGYDMGSYNEDMGQWRDVGDKGLTSLLYSGAAACKKQSFPGVLPCFPKNSFVVDERGASKFVSDRVAEGADYLKIVISDDEEDPIPKKQYEDIIRREAEKKGKNLVSHAAVYAAQTLARKVGGKFITHLPRDKTLTKADVQEMLDNKQVAIPTLIMEQNFLRILRLNPKNLFKMNYSHCKDSLTLMYKMGVPILVGTDATARMMHFAIVKYGEPLHTELQLLSEAGMSTEDIFKGATSLSAKHFGLHDRGEIAPGKRADLVLLDKDPFKDISNSQSIVQVWTAGTKVKGPFGKAAEKCEI